MVLCYAAGYAALGAAGCGDGVARAGAYFQRYLLFRASAAGEGWPRRRPSQQHSAYDQQWKTRSVFLSVLLKNLIQHIDHFVTIPKSTANHSYGPLRALRS